MKRLAVFSFMALVAAFLFLPTSAYAQATRTWVSGVGDDANPCSRTAPCKTFAGAISKTAAGGEIDALDPGGFGGLTITKAITLDGGGGQVASILVSGTNGITVSAGANDVVIIRNIAINGISQTVSPGISGVRFNSGAALILENDNIFGFGTWGVDFEPNAAAQLSVTGSNLSNNGVLTGSGSGGGIFIAPTAGGAKASITNTAILHSNSGLRADSLTSSPVNVALQGSVVSGNVHVGVRARSATGPVTISVDHSNMNNNGTGVYADGSASSIIYLSNSVVMGNTTGVQPVSPGQILSYKNNEINGNTTDGTPLTAVSGANNGLN